MDFKLFLKVKSISKTFAIYLIGQNFYLRRFRPTCTYLPTPHRKWRERRNASIEKYKLSYNNKKLQLEITSHRCSLFYVTSGAESSTSRHKKTHEDKIFVSSNLLQMSSKSHFLDPDIDSLRKLRTCVDFPQPVSPATITTCCSFTCFTMTSRNWLMGRFSWSDFSFWSFANWNTNLLDFRVPYVRTYAEWCQHYQRWH